MKIDLMLLEEISEELKDVEAKFFWDTLDGETDVLDVVNAILKNKFDNIASFIQMQINWRIAKKFLEKIIPKISLFSSLIINHFLVASKVSLDMGFSVNNNLDKDP